MNIRKLTGMYKSGETDPVKYLDSLYESIEKDNLNDFITISKNIAYEAAFMSKRRYEKHEEISALDGVPVSLKDNFALKSIRMTCGSKILEDFISPYNSTVAEKLIEAGAVIVGKNNMDEFAMGSSNETSYFGHVINPTCPGYVPGGSSGGSCAAVAAGHSVVSIGSDTGGSVRQPAAFCGTFGFKPTYGAVSRHGLTAFSSSLDTPAIASMTAEDAESVFDIIRGRDGYDATACNINEDTKEMRRIAYIEGVKGLSSDVKKVYMKTVEKLSKEGFDVFPVELRFLEESISIYQIITMCEVSSNLARYDGIKYGYQIEEADTMYDIYSKVRGEGFGKEVKRRIMTGTYLLSYNNAEMYNNGRRLRRYLTNEIDSLFERTDILVLPTALKPPFKFGERIDDPLAMHLSDSLTAFCNLANVPAVSIDYERANGLPIGVQFVAARYMDRSLLKFASYIEKMRGTNE